MVQAEGKKPQMSNEHAPWQPDSMKNPQLGEAQQAEIQ